MATVTLFFKTPDVLTHALDGLSEEEKERAEEIIRTWLRHGENIAVEVNLETEEARVMEAHEPV